MGNTKSIGLVVSLLLLGCAADIGNRDISKQGTVFQYPDGNITIFLNNRGFLDNPKITKRSVFIAYVFRRADYAVECASEPNVQKCEDKLIFRNEKIDSLAFSNEPGFFGYDPVYGYSPLLVADYPQGSYPTEMPPDPPGMQDPDIWQCYYSSFHKGYRCGINNHPIRYLDLSLSQFHMVVYAADGKGYPSSYLVDYNKFQSLNHPVQDGMRFYVYLAVHYEGILEHDLAEKRFYAGSSVFRRPVLPDLISPRIPIRIKLLAEGPYDAPGSVYDIPPFENWYKPGCEASQVQQDDIVFSEILWAGSEDINGIDDSQDEFFELYNRTDQDLIVSNFRIRGMASGTKEITLPDCTVLPAKKAFAIHRKVGKAFKTANLVIPEIAISNLGKEIAILRPDGSVIHSLNCTSPAWGSQGSNLSPKRSMSLANPDIVPTSCGSYQTTSSTQANYAQKSSRIDTPFRSDSDSLPGTIATPGFP
ncbi:MAG: lamin tail domain-containing protein [Leptospiraceae bacterium]|nr:lamin tail domain-containing protein [Leptospiraceae bacterium]